MVAWQLPVPYQEFQLFMQVEEEVEAIHQYLQELAAELAFLQIKVVELMVPGLESHQIQPIILVVEVVDQIQLVHHQLLAALAVAVSSFSKHGPQHVMEFKHSLHLDHSRFHQVSVQSMFL